MTDTSKRNEGIAKAVKTILATAEDHFDGGWASHPTDDMTKVVSEVVELAVAEARREERERIGRELKRRFIEKAGDNYITLSAMVVLFARSLTTPQEAITNSSEGHEKRD